MAIPLSLGVPRRRGPQSLLEGLLSACVDATSRSDLSVGDSFGPPVVAASKLLDSAGTEAGRVIVDLDVDPAELQTHEQASYEAVRFHLDCSVDQLTVALALRLSAPLAIFVASTGDDRGLGDTVLQIVEAGCVPGLSSGHSIGAVADFLAVLAHADIGYVARAKDTAEVLSLLSGTVASLCGEDTRRALANPEPAKLTVLNAAAAEAVREVLLGVEVSDPSLVERELAALGLQ
ncbi:hypothetical protein [Rhodococcus sp. NPDC049939]|uniref:hypothetical protein n=1 Tax=Rhodococcus sp. NPDC049939 TaxID=3155511 RepID=UPI0033E15DD4